MVLSAVLRNSSVDPGQARRCDRTVFFNPCSRVHTLARYVAGALGALSSAVQAVLLAVGYCLHRAGLVGLEATRGHLRHPVARVHRLLLRILPDYHAAARHIRENQAAAELDFGIGAGRKILSGGRVMTVMKRTVLAFTLATATAVLAL